MQAERRVLHNKGKLLELIVFSCLPLILITHLKQYEQ